MIIFIISLLLIQIVIYLLLDRNNLSSYKWIILGLLIFCNVFVFPDTFIDLEKRGDEYPGLIELMVGISFSFFGNALVILNHIVYEAIKFLHSNEKNRE